MVGRSSSSEARDCRGSMGLVTLATLLEAVGERPLEGLEEEGQCGEGEDESVEDDDEEEGVAAMAEEAEVETKWEKTDCEITCSSLSSFALTDS